MATLSAFIVGGATGCGSSDGSAWAGRNSSGAEHHRAKRPREYVLELSLEELFCGTVKRLTLAADGPAPPPQRRVRGACGGPFAGAPASTSSGGGGGSSGGAVVCVPIAPGLREGTRITVGAAAGCMAAAAGVTLVIKEALHSTFRRVGDDLLAILMVPLVEALTGGRVAIRRLDGRPLEIVLPEDAVARPGQVLSFKGEGMPCALDPSRRGNLHVRLQIDFPASLDALTDAQRALLRKALGA